MAVERVEIRDAERVDAGVCALRCGGAAGVEVRDDLSILGLIGVVGAGIVLLRDLHIVLRIAHDGLGQLPQEIVHFLLIIGRIHRARQQIGNLGARSAVKAGELLQLNRDLQLIFALRTGDLSQFGHGHTS